MCSSLARNEERCDALPRGEFGEERVGSTRGYSTPDKGKTFFAKVFFFFPFRNSEIQKFWRQFFFRFLCSISPALARSIDRKNRVKMTKQRFSTTDVAAEAACLRARVIGYRVTNVYDAGAAKVVFFCFDR